MILSQFQRGGTRDSVQLAGQTALKTGKTASFFTAMWALLQMCHYSAIGLTVYIGQQLSII
jgi:hypothetical protein